MNKQAVKLAEYVQSLPGFVIQTEIDGNYENMGATIIDGILQAGVKYETTVKPRVLRFLKEHEHIKTTSQFRNLIAREGVSELINWKKSSKTERIENLVEFLIIKNIETQVGFSKWLSSEKNCNELKTLSGIKDKTVDYFKILVGHSTNAVDRHLIEFLRKAGIETCDYKQVQNVISEAARILQIEEACFDHSIWKYMSNGNA